MPDIRVYYFDVRGRAEILRLVLAMVGQDFEDVRFSREEWKSKYKAEAPFGQAPFIEYNGKKYGETAAIAAFFAEEFGVYGKTPLDHLRIGEVARLTEDLINTLLPIYEGQLDATKKAELNRKATEEDIPRYFGFCQKLLQENSPHAVFVGTELTLADLYVYDQMFMMKRARHYDAGEAFPHLQTLTDRVESHPRLKVYLANRKDTVG